MKHTQNDQKGTNNDKKETRTQINNLEQKEEINIQPEQMMNQEFKNMKKGLRNPGTSLNSLTSEL